MSSPDLFTCIRWFSELLHRPSHKSIRKHVYEGVSLHSTQSIFLPSCMNDSLESYSLLSKEYLASISSQYLSQEPLNLNLLSVLTMLNRTVFFFFFLNENLTEGRCIAIVDFRFCLKILQGDVVSVVISQWWTERIYLFGLPSKQFDHSGHCHVSNKHDSTAGHTNERKMPSTRKHTGGSTVLALAPNKPRTLLRIFFFRRVRWGSVFGFGFYCFCLPCLY